MKKKELEKLKEILLSEKRKILNHLEEISKTVETDLSSNSLTSGDEADIASAEINQAALQKIGKRETYLLKKIEKSLKKIEEGTYGICEECGEEIGVARLMARPVADYCIDCKTELENLERRYTDKRDEEPDVDVGDEELIVEE